jgi:hypothetical protein
MFGRHPMFGPMYPQRFTNMPFFNPQPLPPRPGIGGFLTRLFSRGQAASPGHFGMAMPTLPNAANTMNAGGGISGMLGNVQKALGVVQQITPMVQQYGSLVKNLPAMIKLFRELEPADEAEKDTKAERSSETKNKTSSKAKKERELPTTLSKKEEAEPRAEQKGISKPKLYI